MNGSKKARRHLEKRRAQQEAALRYSQSEPDVIIEDTHSVSSRFSVPVQPEDLAPVETMLRRADPFCVSFPAGPGLNDPYNSMTYLFQTARYETRIVCLLDRNVVSPVVQLGRGEHASDEHRIAAAIMSFSQCARIELEPGLAIYELAATHGGEKASDEIVPFRTVDRACPQVVLDLALGRVNKIRSSWLGVARTKAQRVSRAQPAPAEYEKAISLYQFNYVAALKIVLLECSGHEPEKKLSEWFEWMYAEFVWVGVATSFAARYFARNAQKPNWLNGIRSIERERAVARARNIAWDLSFVALWVRKLRHAQESDENVLWILCSLDHAVREVARLYVLPDANEEDVGEEFLSRLVEWYGTAAGRNLAARYQELTLKSSSSERREPHLYSDSVLRALTAELESAVRGLLRSR